MGKDGAARAWLRDAAAIVALAMLPPVFLKIVPGGLPPYGGDVLIHVYPLLSLLAHSLHAGRPTLWNFYAAGGYPLAPYSALALYPPVAAALLTLPVTGAIAALYIFYDAVLGIGMYLLAGDLGLSRSARLLAGVTLAASGFVAAHAYAGHLLELGAICPLPVAFLLLRRAIRRHSWRYAVWCGAVSGLMILAAGVQFLPFALALLPLLALWHTILQLRLQLSGVGEARRRVIWPLAALALAALAAAALGAAFLLPFREILGATLRASPVPFKTATAQSLPGGGLLMLLAPNAFGNAAAGDYWPASRFGPYFHEIYAYAGLLPLLLAPVALRRREAWPYAALAVLALVVMLGQNTPLYQFLYDLPGGQLLRAPVRAGLLLDIALALLAAFGLDALRGGAVRLLVPGAVVALAVAAVLFIATLVAGAIPPAGHNLALAGAVRLVVVLAASIAACRITVRDRRLALLLPALALLDLFAANGALLRPTDPAAYYRNVAAPRTLPSGAAAYAYSYRILALDDAVPPGLGMVTRTLYDTQDPAPLALQDYWALSHPSLVQSQGVIATGRDIIRDADPFFLRLFGVHTLFSSTQLHDPALHLAGSITTVVWNVPGGASWNVDRRTRTSLVYRYDAALPRYVVVPRAIAIPNPAAALAALRHGAVDPAHSVVLSRTPAALPGPLAALQRGWAAWLGGNGDGEINALALDISGGASGGYLVIDDGWFPGWVASVDGRDAPVRRADYLLRAVRLPPGRHHVRLVYAPLTYLLGAAITLATALMLLGLAIFTVARFPRRGNLYER